MLVVTGKKVDPVAFLSAAGIGGWEVEYCRGEVRFQSREGLLAAAENLGISLHPLAVGFEAHGWRWVAGAGERPCGASGREGGTGR